jgi:phosphate transport system substrate-binding protein
MSPHHNLQDKNKTILILSVSIALGFVTGWWLLQQDFPQFAKPDRPSKFSTVGNVPKGLFYYGGSTVWGEIRENLEPVIETVHPQFQLNYKFPPASPSSGRGIAMLLDNQLDFALSARPLTIEEHQEAQQRGFTIKEIPVAIYGTAIVVNHKLPISNLTVQQFCQIYDGSITNWRELGGPDLSIVPYLKPDQKNQFCYRWGGTSKSIELVPETTLALQKVQTNLGGIYWSSATLLVPQCGIKTLKVNNIPPYKLPAIPPENCPTQRNQPNVEAFRKDIYPLTGRLWVIVKENELDAQAAGEAYAELLLTEEGQTRIRDSGFVNIK